MFNFVPFRGQVCLIKILTVKWFLTRGAHIFAYKCMSKSTQMCVCWMIWRDSVKRNGHSPYVQPIKKSIKCRGANNCGTCGFVNNFLMRDFIFSE